MSSLKTIDEVVNDVRRRLRNNWHTDLAGVTTSFPHKFFLGKPSKQALDADWPSHHNAAVEWRDWAELHGVHLEQRNRDVQGTSQRLPEYLLIEGIDAAADVAAGDWSQCLNRNRERLTVLEDRFPHIDNVAAALRATDKYNDVDFDLLLTVADWFNTNPGQADGLTPRMVPLPGVHAKWLQGHRAGVAALTGVTIDDLIRHPQRIHFTYLDPVYRQTGARIHDSATVGDAFTPAYLPTVVVISENKDTALHFPQLPGGIAVEGVGRGGKTPAGFPWLRDAPTVIYWGDIDKDGYEILDGYRLDFDRDIDSILMDRATYDTYERFGTDRDEKGNLLQPGTPKDTKRLNTAERSVYEALLDANHTGHRRVEQERIPLSVALVAVVERARTGCS